MKKVNLMMMLCFGMALSISACTNKVEDPQPEPEEHANTAVITIHSPSEDTAYSHSDSVSINVTAVGEQTLHGWQLNFREKGDTTLLFTKNAHAHSQTITIAEKWANTVHHDSEVELEVIVGLDHDGNKASKKVSFHCKP